MTNHPNRGQQPRPRQRMLAVGQMYPRAWKLADEFRAGRGKSGMPDWPEWCYLPLGGWYAVVSDDASVPGHLPLNLVPDVARLAALGAWRATQSIYRFDPDLRDMITGATIDTHIIERDLYQLPEWCPYIEIETDYAGYPICGYWAHLEYDANTGGHELRLLLDMTDPDTLLMPVPLHLGTGDLRRSAEQALTETRRQLIMHSASAGLPAKDWDAPTAELIADEIMPLVALVRHLCNDQADYPRPEKPKPKKIKKRWRLVAPDRATIREVTS